MLLRVIRVLWKHRDIWTRPSRAIRKISYRQCAIQVFSTDFLEISSPGTCELLQTRSKWVFCLNLRIVRVVFVIGTMECSFLLCVSSWIHISSCSLFVHVCVTSFVIVLHRARHPINTLFSRAFAFTHPFILPIMSKYLSLYDFNWNGT